MASTNLNKSVTVVTNINLKLGHQTRDDLRKIFREEVQRLKKSTENSDKI